MMKIKDPAERIEVDCRRLKLHPVADVPLEQFEVHSNMVTSRNALLQTES